MISGYKTCQFYKALKLHFTVESFNIFENKGNIKGSYEAYLRRKDHVMFEKLAKKLETDRKVVQYIASNFMYDNPDMIWDYETGSTNYLEYLKNKESLSYIFKNDLDTILNYSYTQMGCNKLPDVIRLLMNRQISIETVVILNKLDNLCENLKNTGCPMWVLESHIMRIKKSDGFVKLDSNSRIEKLFQTFKEELKTHHEQDLSLSA
jgi:hypothetical protein